MYYGGLEREAESEWENVPIVLFAPGSAIDSIVRMKKHDELVTSKGFPHRIQAWVVEAFTQASCSHNDTLQMG
jgi:hypothetical protein